MTRTGSGARRRGSRSSARSSERGPEASSSPPTTRSAPAWPPSSRSDALIVVTGALHVDGLADCADALGVRGGREPRLAVMRESTIGAFGVVAIVLHALLLATAIAGLRDSDVLSTLIVAGVLSRCSAVAHGALAPPARPGGLGAAFVVTPIAMTIATAAGVVTALALLGPHGLVGLAERGWRSRPRPCGPVARSVVGRATPWGQRLPSLRSSSFCCCSGSPTRPATVRAGRDRASATRGRARRPTRRGAPRRGRPSAGRCPLRPARPRRGAARSLRAPSSPGRRPRPPRAR